MGFTKQQAQCINTLDRPLVVTAGAGSGKTFTLTQRIVHALESGAIDDIEQLLAITYTEKAAGELKTRIYRELRAHGLIEQALKANNAWISTIHGMCSRILREHAIELGLNPDFAILPEALASRLLDDAVNETLEESLESSDTEVAAFLSEYPAESTGFASMTSRQLIWEMGKTLEKQNCGFTLRSIPEPWSRGTILNKLHDAASALYEEISNQKESGSQGKALAKAEELTARYEAIVANGSFNELSDRRFLEDVNAFPLTGFASFGNQAYKAIAHEITADVAECMAEATLRAAMPFQNAIVKLGSKAWDKLQARKRELGYLSNDDLLSLTYQAMEDHPQIADRYRNKFKLVMVDEFQDTNQMQVDMISKLAGAHGERLCVVGDAQQSIYRFQGADVSVYEQHLKNVDESDEGQVIMLPDNFRSHRDVLALVDAVFAQPEAFGGSFMHLDAKRDEARCNPRYNDLPSRVEVQRTVRPASGDSEPMPTSEMMAKRLAQRFKELHDEGFSLGDMVILMGSTSNASIYAAALRELGLPCVVVKGSVFNKASEVNLMVDAVYALVNPDDSEHLYRVMSSPMFNLSAQNLLDLATRLNEDNQPRRRTLWQGLCAAAFDENSNLDESCVLAAKALTEACNEARYRHLSHVLLQLVNDSGWLMRLHGQGAEGQAIAANILKAIRVLENLEKTELVSGSSLAFRYESEIASLKEAPGALSAENGEFVRILTIHSSKGLEFPIVAVTEYEKKPAGAQSLNVAEWHRDIRFDMLPNRSIDRLDSLVKAKSKEGGHHPCADLDDDEVRTVLLTSTRASEVHDAMLKLNAQADEAERLRLFYVALTRAKEMAIICMSSRASKNNAVGKLGTISSLVESALAGVEGFGDIDICQYDFGGSKPAIYTMQYCDEAMQSNEHAGKDATPFMACEPFETSYEMQGDYEPVHERVFSYSSLSGYELEADAPLFDSLVDIHENDEGNADDSQFEHCVPSDPEKATDFGTAFHLLAQSIVLKRKKNKPLAMPSIQEICDMSARHRLKAQQIPRLTKALETWCRSTLAAKISALDSLQAEVPFFVELPPWDDCPAEGAAEFEAEKTASDESNDASKGNVLKRESSDASGDDAATFASPLFLEGEIDLLAEGGINAPNDHSIATLVDYKTGGNANETREDLLRKHGLQARCYAYALLKSGYHHIDAHFVRVEQEQGSDNEPQVVSFSFDASDLTTIESDLKAACRHTASRS